MNYLCFNTNLYFTMIFIPKITVDKMSIDAIAQKLAQENIQRYAVESVNWPDVFAYCPQTYVRFAHAGDRLFIQYEVTEIGTKALVTEDNGPVWTDSCCECFLSFDQTGYYNFETSCIGTQLLAFRITRENPTRSTPEILQKIERHSSLGRNALPEQAGETHYQLTVSIPVSAFFTHAIQDLSGMDARLNVYKCGDKLSKPHYISLFPIDFPKPNFHLSQFFGEAHFE